ncbi:ASGR1 [Branchiostoma lanceolatum]|uniref:ASGR1 protein n=1 Tax=Branchiostoma lanceolatum TaxID=7740 RepID=A0A8J9WBA0_BRALA|nr:ASGR1 [Branchiostoma lanceolatum]
MEKNSSLETSASGTNAGPPVASRTEDAGEGLTAMDENCCEEARYAKDTGNEYEEACAVSKLRSSARIRAPEQSTPTESSTDEVVGNYIPGVGMRSPGQSRVCTSAMMKTVSALSLVLNCCLLGTVIFLAVAMSDLKLSVKWLDKKTEMNSADLSNVADKLQQATKSTHGLSASYEKHGNALRKLAASLARLTDSQMSGISDMLKMLEKAGDKTKKLQEKSDDGTDPPPPCPEGYQKYRQLCFKAFPSIQTFSDAAAACRADGGTLAMPRDPGTNGFLVSLINAKYAFGGSGDYWFGLHDRNEEGKWRWLDGTALETRSTMWGRDQPNNLRVGEDCVVYGWKNFWYDSVCQRKVKFICQVMSTGSY